MNEEDVAPSNAQLHDLLHLDIMLSLSLFQAQTLERVNILIFHTKLRNYIFFVQGRDPDPVLIYKSKKLSKNNKWFQFSKSFLTHIKNDQPPNPDH